MSKVLVTANELGLVVIPSSNNPEYGYIRVEQTQTGIVNGWLTPKTRSALIRGKVADLQMLGWKAGMPLDGKIVIKESHTPTNPNNLDQDLKLAGDSGIPCTFDDQPIYRSAFYTTDMEEKDVLIAHNNGEAIKTAQKVLRDRQPNGATL